MDKHSQSNATYIDSQSLKDTIVQYIFRPLSSSLVFFLVSLYSLSHMRTSINSIWCHTVSKSSICKICNVCNEMLIWSYCLQQGQATLGYHSGREQCQYTLGWKPFVPPDVLTYFYSLSSSHRPSLPTSIPIPQNTNTNKRTRTNTAKRPDLFLRLSFSSHHMCSARCQTEGVFFICQ